MGKLDLQMEGYSYKMIRSEDFLEHFLDKINQFENLSLIKEIATEVDITKKVVSTEKNKIEAEYIFDSRFGLSEIESCEQPTVLQHFKGRLVKSSTPIFDESTFTMMDFRTVSNSHCSFVYVLPFSAYEGLVEYTFFSPEVLKEEEYDQLINHYLHKIYPDVQFSEIGSEQGVIPMSTYDFSQYNSSSYCKIGTAGGWVKPSSGYSFKMAEKKSKQLVENLSNGKRLDQGVKSKKYLFYDKVFLSILQNENELGNQLFIEMYRKNRASKIFKFLDEESSITEDLQIIRRFKSKPFLRAINKEFL